MKSTCKPSRTGLMMAFVGALCFLSLMSVGYAQQPDFDKVEIKTVPVSDGVAMLMGWGGNLGVSYGEDGVFLIDDQFAPLSKKIKAAIAGLSNQPVRFLINTHWHFDHTGGNENFGKAGAVIVAHENVRKRMSVDQVMKAFNTTIPAAPKAALPLVTFTRDVTFHLNGDELKVYHAKNAHTDGDAVIRWTNANVVHTGDLFFAGIYPFIDIESGGSINGMIEAVTNLLPTIDNETKIIPGHGPLSDKAELISYLGMLTEVRDRVKTLISEGKSRDEVVAAKPTAKFDEKLGQGFLTPQQFVGMVYMDLARSQS